jgi:hypothetical protein
MVMSLLVRPPCHFLKHPSSQLVVAGLGVEFTHPGARLELAAFPAEQDPFLVTAGPDGTVPALRVIVGQPAAAVPGLGVHQSGRISGQVVPVRVTVAAVSAAETDESFRHVLRDSRLLQRDSAGIDVQAGSERIARSATGLNGPNQALDLAIQRERQSTLCQNGVVVLVLQRDFTRTDVQARSERIARSATDLNRPNQALDLAIQREQQSRLCQNNVVVLARA